MQIRSRQVILLAVVTVVTLVAVGSSEARAFDEDELRPGLLSTMSDARHTVHGVAHRLSFDWTDSNPDGRLTSPLKAEWSGNLLVRQPGSHTFHARVSGNVVVTVDDTVVLNTKGENAFHSASATELSAGDHLLKITFDTAEATDPKLQLFWSSPDFTLEPLPGDAFSHATDSSGAADQQSGRTLADAMRCAACHQGMDELPVVKAPSLLRVNELSSSAIVQRLLDPHAVDPGTGMPSFGFTPAEAENVAAFLLSVAAKDKLKDEPVTFKADDAAAGQKLLLTTGCAACHSLPDLPLADGGHANPYHGPDLNRVAGRRSAEWLTIWLKSPEELNSDHRMPVFSLSDDERRQIVAALMTVTQPDAEAKETENVGGKESGELSAAEKFTEGRRLVTASQCTACHSIPTLEAPAKKRPRVSADEDLSAVSSCVGVSPVNRVAQQTSEIRQPVFQVSEVQQRQLQAWTRTLHTELHHASRTTMGELLLNRSGCLSCHDRDQHRGLSKISGHIESLREDLRGQSQALIPPALTAVGDKLRDDYLQTAIAGEHPTRRLPWLFIRMPKFRFSPDERTAIVNHFVGSDRIPDEADAARPELFEHLNPHHPSLATAAELLTGNQLVGAGGFNCIACHKAGAYEPRSVAMGTRGSDIMTMGQRIRPRYFMRWMQNPIRVVSGIEMPAIRKAMPGVLEDSLPAQIATIWKSMADPKFTPPTVVSRYEQFVTVSPGQRPRIIRDVFTVGDPSKRNSIARAFAVGFNNGHNLLIDLDTMQLRQWAVGEFARQRTEGKSWFWDMAGVLVSSAPAELLSCELKQKNLPDSGALKPIADLRRNAELISYSVADESVMLRIRYYFDGSTIDGTQKSPEVPTDKGSDKSRHTARTAWNDPERNLLQAIVSYTLQPVGRTLDSTGWSITANVEECPQEYALHLAGWQTANVAGEIPWKSTVQTMSESGTAEVLLEKSQRATLTLDASVVPPGIVPPAIPALTSSSDEVTSLPGFEGRRLPIETNIMPTAITWLPDGRMAFASLRGQIWIAKDTDGDKLMDRVSLFAEGLAAPYGIQADGNAILVSHKPEVLRLRDSDDDGMADEFDVFASGWGFSDDYHDWTTALARDRNGDYFVGLGSDYSQNKRAADNDRWRGTILKISSAGAIDPVAYSFRFPMGLAFDTHQNLFATDNQGVQNTFNELNHVISGKHYGVPSRHETAKDVMPESASVMIPHPWTRSVNSIVFFPDDYAVRELAGHGVGCEYDTRCLIRFTIQDVNGTMQGASYRFSLPEQPGGGSNFVGPVASSVGPDGALYIGSIWDSGWQGGTNTGAIERLMPMKSMPNGIREIRATPTGFDVSFFHPVDLDRASDLSNWSLQAYTRNWGGSYATPDSDRHSLVPTATTASVDRTVISLTTGNLEAGYVYEISVKQPLDASPPGKFWPTEGHYSMKTVPQ
jgi:mono/diheme cytochrome c family protein